MRFLRWLWRTFNDDGWRRGWQRSRRRGGTAFRYGDDWDYLHAQRQREVDMFMAAKQQSKKRQAE